MAKQVGPVFLTGTIDGVCYYKMNGQYYARAKSSLSRKRVKKSPAFRRTMEYAGWLAQASAIASGIYRLIPRTERRMAVYRAITGKAMGMLKEGVNEEAVKVRLEREMVVISKEPAQANSLQEVAIKQDNSRQRAWLRRIKARGKLRVFIGAPQVQKRRCRKGGGESIVPGAPLFGLMVDAGYGIGDYAEQTDDNKEECYHGT